jgi:hypothetical protein
MMSVTTPLADPLNLCMTGVASPMDLRRILESVRDERRHALCVGAEVDCGTMAGDRNVLRCRARRIRVLIIAIIAGERWWAVASGVASLGKCCQSHKKKKKKKKKKKWGGGVVREKKLDSRDTKSSDQHASALHQRHCIRLVNTGIARSTKSRKGLARFGRCAGGGGGWRVQISAVTRFCWWRRHFFIHWKKKNLK